MKTIKDKITLSELKKMAKERFGSLVKAVVDVEKGIMALDGEMHADEEALLLSRGSRQEDLWGINIYPELPKSQWLEFDSIINLRPSSGNKSRNVEDPKTRNKIIEIVNKLVQR
jgi:hypothetical protein